MSAPITEAHIDLVRYVLDAEWYGTNVEKKFAQEIADSEARAVASAVTMLTCTHHNDQQRAACPVCLVAALAAERDRLRAEVERLTAQRENLLKPMRDQAIARADRAEAELANIRALANRRNKQNHSHDTTHQLVASLDQSLDIVQAELVEERWLKGCAIKRSQELLSELAAEREKVRTLSLACERIVAQWDKNHDAAPFHAGNVMYWWACGALATTEDAE